MKGTRQCNHTRVSKRGIPFSAGRGMPKPKRRSYGNKPRFPKTIEIIPSGKYPEVQWASKKKRNPDFVPEGDEIWMPEDQRHFGASPRWIQKANLKKGALSRQLGIKEEDNIPSTLLDKIVAAKAGETIKNPTESGRSRIKVTRKLERRAILARNLKNLRRN